MLNKSIEIRGYKENEHKQIQDICIAVVDEAFLGQPDMEEKVLVSYCNYYIEKEPNNCFVAVDGEKVAGYILCAEDTTKWVENFKKDYIDKAKNEELKKYYEGTTEIPLKYANEYPAHLHIDLLPEYQRLGLGHKLMNALIEHLKSKGNKGLMLVVGSDNEKGVNFYKKFGFSVLEDLQGAIVMGIKLDK